MRLDSLTREPQIKTEKTPLFILIHGYGSNEEDLYSFADDLPDTFFVTSLRAPHTLMHNGYAWYEIDFVNAEKFNNTEQAKASEALILQFIDETVQRHNLDAQNVWLCGFSQGAILSYSMALNHPEKIKNLVCLSGYTALDIIGEVDAKKNFSHLDFYISHGTEDAVIPIDWARKAPELLSNLHIKNTYKEYRAGHQLVQQNYIDMLHWINERAKLIPYRFGYYR